jgi:hypothetical protein
MGLMHICTKKGFVMKPLRNFRVFTVWEDIPFLIALQGRVQVFDRD